MANCKRLKSFLFIFLGEDPSFEVKNVETNVPAVSLDICISNFSKWLRKKLLKTQMQIRIVC